MTSLNFIAIDSLSNDLLLPWLDLYETAFPPEERVLVSNILEILKGMDKGKKSSFKILAATDSRQNFVGMALYELNLKICCAFLWYLAITPKNRGHGLGNNFYQEIIGQVQKAGYQVMFFEVEMPENVDSIERKVQSERRIQFYRKNGAKLLKGIYYTQSVGPHQPDTQMHLMIHPFENLEPKKVFAIAKKQFKQHIRKVSLINLE
jgi:GNAT superfamily N-acetyltransferase